MTRHTKQTSLADVGPPIVVDTIPALHQMIMRLMQHPHIGVDTESNSLHAYQERVCLIQISIPGQNYLVDPLAIDDMSSLGQVFSASEIVKIFHAADYDLSVLLRDFGFECSSLFDTMWAGRILGWSKVGLGDILDKYFGINVNKRYQRYDWGKRPIDQNAITYAWMDSYYLLPLRELQITELKNKGRWEEAQEIFSYLLDTVHVPENLLETHFWRIKEIHKLTTYEQKVLYKLYLWREGEAKRLDRPTMKVISNQRLVRLARTQPHTVNQLVAAGLTTYQAKKFGQGLLKALNTQRLPKLPPQPEQKHPPVEVIKRYKRLRVWRRDIAAGRSVPSDVILPNAVLWELAAHPPHSLDELQTFIGLGPWRCMTYGPDLIRILNNEG